MVDRSALCLFNFLDERRCSTTCINFSAKTSKKKWTRATEVTNWRMRKIKGKTRKSRNIWAEFLSESHDRKMLTPPRLRRAKTQPTGSICYAAETNRDVACGRRSKPVFNGTSNDARAAYRRSHHADEASVALHVVKKLQEDCFKEFPSNSEAKFTSKQLIQQLRKKWLFCVGQYNFLPKFRELLLL